MAVWMTHKQLTHFADGRIVTPRKSAAANAASLLVLVEVATLFVGVAGFAFVVATLVLLALRSPLSLLSSSLLSSSAFLAGSGGGGFLADATRGDVFLVGAAAVGFFDSAGFIVSPGLLTASTPAKAASRAAASVALGTFERP